MGNQLIVRQLEKDDREQFLAILSQLSKLDDAEAVFDAVFEERAKYENITFVADLNGTLLGTASIHFERKFAHGGQYCGYIEDVVVDDGYRGLRIGELLVKSLLELAKKVNKVYKVVLDCEPKVAKFYEKLGFKWDGEAMRINLV